MRRAAKVDRNQPEIVAALRKAGATVQHLHTVGQGCPDLLVGYQDRTYLIEVKVPGETLTPDEKRWFQGWLGGYAGVAYGIDSALAIIGATVAVMR